MSFEESILQFFEEPRTRFLVKEEAIAYFCYRILRGSCYGSGLEKDMKAEYRLVRMSDTVMYQAIEALERAGYLASSPEKCPSKGRPRRMFTIAPTANRDFIEKAAIAWEQHFGEYRKSGSCEISA